jgi:regulator of sigma E protease
LSEVAAGGVAAAAGLEAGDRITSYGGREIENWHALAHEIQASPDESAELEFLRGDELKAVMVTPEPVFVDSIGKTVGKLGITSDPTDLPFLHMSLNLPRAFTMATRETWETGTMVVDILARLISGQLSMRKTMGGPVTIVAMATRSARSGLLSLLLFVAFVSVNLGVLNLLPIPVLDGGHLVFLGFEAMRGRPLSVKVRLMATQVGMAFIILIMLYVTVNDFLRLL